MNLYITFRRTMLAVLMLVIFSLAALLLPMNASAVTELSAIDGSAAILVDARTGEVLYEQSADTQIAPASTTKIMTALLVAEAVQRGEIAMTDMVTLTDEIMHDIPSDASRVGNAMVVGEQVPVRDLLYLSLMESDCVACDMLAVHVSGSVERFVNQMNVRAQQLGCTGTTFLNSHGYPTEGHIATARSLYLITAEASKHQLFMEAFGCLKYVMPETNKASSRTLYSTDKLLYDPSIVESTYTPYFNEYVTGGKTGYSKSSGNCLVSTAEKGGMKLISVITGVQMKYPDEQTVIDAFTETDRLLMWGFDNFASYIIVNEGQSLQEITVKKGEPEVISGVCAETIYVTLEKGVPRENVQITSSLREEVVEAPVSSGDLLGSVALMMDGKVIATTELVASADSQIAPKKFLPNVPLIIILSIIVAAGAAFLVYYTNKNELLLLDLAKTTLGLSDSKPAAKRARPIENNHPVEEDTQKKDNEDPFDEFFARYGNKE